MERWAKIGAASPRHTAKRWSTREAICEYFGIDEHAGAEFDDVAILHPWLRVVRLALLYYDRANLR